MLISADANDSFDFIKEEVTLNFAKIKIDPKPSLEPDADNDDGLLLPAVQTDDDAITDGTSNTIFFSERYAGPGDDADDGLLLPAVQKVGAARDWPSSNDTHQQDGLLLPAVQTDFGLLLPY